MASQLRSDRIQLTIESLSLSFGAKSIETIDPNPRPCPDCPTNHHAVCLLCRGEGEVCKGRFLGYEVDMPASVGVPYRG